MHKFMRTVGFSMYQKKQDMAKLLKRLAKEAEMTGRLAEQEGSRFCELRTEVAPGMGVAMIGEMSPKGTFSREYYFPYVKNPDVSSEAECSIQRHTERETYAGLLDEYRVGISLIFYMENSMEYRMRRSARQPVQPKGAALTGLAVQGKVLLPVNKTEKTGRGFPAGCQKTQQSPGSRQTRRRGRHRDTDHRGHRPLFHGIQTDCP